MLARQRILSLTGDGVMLGAGVGGTVFCLMLLGAARDARRARTGTALEPVERLHWHPSAADPAGRIPDWIRARPAHADCAAGGVSGGARDAWWRNSARGRVRDSSTSRSRTARRAWKAITDGRMTETARSPRRRGNRCLRHGRRSFPFRNTRNRRTRPPSRRTRPWPNREASLDTDEPECTDGDGAAARRREPGEEFF